MLSLLENGHIDRTTVTDVTPSMFYLSDTHCTWWGFAVVSSDEKYMPELFLTPPEPQNDPNE